jgi:hypothetical protein
MVNISVRRFQIGSPLIYLIVGAVRRYRSKAWISPGLIAVDIGECGMDNRRKRAGEIWESESSY